MVSLGGHVLTGAPQTFADGTTGTLTASFTYNAATGAGVISYSYTLIDNTLVDPSSSSSFAVVVTDADGDSAPAGNLVIYDRRRRADGACRHGCDGCGSVHGGDRQRDHGGWDDLAGERR